MLAALILATLPLVDNGDSSVRAATLGAALRTGTLTPEKYSLIGPLFAAPLWAVAGAESKVATVWLFNRYLLIVGAAALFWALRPVLTPDQRPRLLVLLGFASVVPTHAMYFGGEPFTAVCVGVGTAAAVVRRKWWGWPLAAVGAANVPATVVGLALAAAVACWHRRRLRFGLAVVGAAVLVLAENWLRRGHPFAGGYDNDHGYPTVLPYSGRPGFSYPFVLGALSILLSFGKGLVFFIPALFLPLNREPATPTDREADLRLLYRIWLAFVVGLVLVYSPWWAWYGGVCWGPRFFLFAALPAALVLARRTTTPDPRLWVNGVVLAALALSCWVGVAGTVYRDVGPGEFFSDDFALEFALWYVPELSPLWLPFAAPHPLDATDIARLIAFGLAAVYLAAPLAGTVLRQAFAAVRHGWAEFPRFRL